MSTNNILVLTPLKFYSSDDETLFFDWIRKIECIESYEGIGRELHVKIVSRPVTFDEYRNLYGIFKRYNLNHPEQLEKIFGGTQDS